MSGNLSGNNIDNGDFMIKTCAADPEAGYAKEKFHADPKNGIIISEVDGVKGRRLEFSADWSVVSLDTKLKEGDNIKIREDQQTGKVEISAPDVGKVKYNDEFLDLAEGDGISLEKDGDNLKVSATNNGKVLVNSSDTNADFLDNKIKVYFPLQKSVKYDNSELQIIVLDKLNFAQYYERWNGGDYDKSDISVYYGEAAMLGKIYRDEAGISGVCFVVIQGNPLTLHIRYTATSDADCVLYYRIIGDANWNSQSVTLNNSYGEVSQTSFDVPNIGDSPMEFLLVCEEEMGNYIARIFEIYAV